MKIRSMISAASLCAVAGMALAQPTTDGVFNPATEGAFYGDIIWFNNVPTGFGDNQAGDFTGGNFGLPPQNVTTGIEVVIPLSAIGGATNFRLAGWVNSGDRSFMSNQLIHSGLPMTRTTSAMRRTSTTSRTTSGPRSARWRWLRVRSR